MCGLVGIAGDLTLKDEKTMRRLLLFDFLRGVDSTGLAAIRKVGDPIISKISSHPIDLFEMPKFKQTLVGPASLAFIGHNRAATRGGVNSYNAHPFQFGPIVGAHNGTLTSKTTTVLEEKVGMKFPVDSMAIFAAFESIGVAAAIPLMEEGKTSVDGAWALTWHDADDGEEGSINFLRNKHRPLFYAFTKDFKKIIWASEYPMIEAAVRLGDNPDELFVDADGNAFFSFIADKHYRFDLKQLRAGVQEGSPPKPKVVERKGAEVATYTGNFPHRNGGGVTNGGITPTQMSTSSTTQSLGQLLRERAAARAREKDDKDNVVHLFGDDSTPFAGIISAERFAELAKSGCNFCKEPITIHTTGVTIVDSDDIVLCPKCSTHGTQTQRIILPRAEINKLL